MKVQNGEVVLENILDRLDWAIVFPEKHPVILDLGAGDGGFAAEYARLNPQRNVLGVERLLGRARKIARKSVRLELANLRVLRLESTYLLEHLVPAGSVSEIHVLFPDPWPKKRHLNRRIIQPAFLETVVRALGPGGLFRFATDHTEYFESALPVLTACPDLFPIDPPESYPCTDFEREFRAEGKPINDQVWRRREHVVRTPYATLPLN